ncbi:MAG: hypothetical protein EXX96DRAFT_83261 [Benjaminiella poitrasii]|nr:MAG: hypothetical protein EXX96DRAFT_83261 [Benjaminiella poitrasii]
MNIIQYKHEFAYLNNDLENMSGKDTIMNSGHVLQLVALDSNQTSPDVKMEELIKELVTTNTLVEKITTDLNAFCIEYNGKKKSKYGPEQIRAFIGLIQEEGLSILEAVNQCMIPRSTGHVLLKEFNAGSGDILSGKSSKTKEDDRDSHLTSDCRTIMPT